jgi:hypothetical protein
VNVFTVEVYEPGRHWTEPPKRTYLMWSDNLPGCAVCEKQPSASCQNQRCGWRDFCRDRDDRREVARIMGLSDAEIAAEVTRDGETPESVAARCRAIFERACAIVDTRRAGAVTNGPREGAT